MPSNSQRISYVLLHLPYTYIALVDWNLPKLWLFFWLAWSMESFFKLVQRIAYLDKPVAASVSGGPIHPELFPNPHDENSRLQVLLLGKHSRNIVTLLRAFTKSVF